jgi:hypothetical protein
MAELRDAARQALEALEKVKYGLWEEDSREGRALITALKAALEQPEPDAIEQALAHAEAFSRGHDAGWQSAIAHRAALEQPEQTCNCRWVGDVQTQQCTLHEAHVDTIHEWAERAKAAEAKLAALEQPEQEPVAWRYQNSLTDTEYLVWNKGTGGRNWTPLYTHPPRREWRGLSEEEIQSVIQLEREKRFQRRPPLPLSMTELSHAIEQALRSKNHD